MSSERPRQVPLAVHFGRQVQSRSSLRELLLSAALHLGVLVALVWGGRHLAEVSGRPGEGPGRGGGHGVRRGDARPAAAAPRDAEPALHADPGHPAARG